MFFTPMTILGLVLTVSLYANSSLVCSKLFETKISNSILSIDDYEYYSNIFDKARGLNQRIPIFKTWKVDSDDAIRSGEYAAIYYYTVHPSFVEINSNLRKNTPEKELKPFIRAVIKLIISGLSKLPDFKGSVYRGGVRNEVFYDEVLEKYKVGTIITEPTFLSTSEGSRSRVHFKSDPLVDFYIVSKTGKDIQDIAINPKEHEILFLPGTRFHVDKVVDSPRLKIWMTEI